MPSPGRMIDTLTPKTRRVSKLPQAEVRMRKVHNKMGKLHLAFASLPKYYSIVYEAEDCSVQRSYALEVACRCVESAYQAREGPAIAHAAHLRADG